MSQPLNQNPRYRLNWLRATNSADPHRQSDRASQPFPKLKYAQIERERRFLLPPQDFHFNPVRTLFIRDRYLIGSTLRLRRVEEDGQPPLFKLGQKIRLEINSPSTVAHTTMYLTEAEFESLAVMPADTLEKTRLLSPVGDLTLAVDVFSGHLAGLTLAELDLGDVGELPSSLPIETTIEVTADERFTGGSLAAMSEDDLQLLLGSRHGTN